MSGCDKIAYNIYKKSGKYNNSNRTVANEHKCDIGGTLNQLDIELWAENK